MQSGMKPSEVLEIGGLQFVLGNKISSDYIKSKKDAEIVNKLINDQLKNYRLDMLLLKIHDDLLKEKFPEYPLFAFVSITKSVMLNCSMHGELTSMPDEEFLELLRITTECETYEPWFAEEMRINPKRAAASYLLRTIGKQSQWNRNIRYMLSRTLYIYEELINDTSVPAYIKSIVKSEFEKVFGLPLHDFIKIVAILFARSSSRDGGMRRDYFDKARNMGMPVPSDEIVKAGLRLISCDTTQFREDIMLKKYNLNPLTKYPLIRLWEDCENEEAFDDKFIAPVPELLLLRITIGLYYQLYHKFGEKFKNDFGELFELYVGKIIDGFNLPHLIIAEKDIDRYLPTKGKKGTKARRPDWIIFSDKGIILIECKATHYTQDMFEHGIEANNMACLDQIRKALDQFAKFEPLLPNLCKKVGKAYSNLKLQKVIVSLEPMLGLNGGPLKEFIDGRRERDWILLPVEELEEIQHHIAKGYDLWSFLLEYKYSSYNDRNRIIEKMESQTKAEQSENMFYSYRLRIFDELLKDVEAPK